MTDSLADLNLLNDILPDGLLDTFRERAARYDRDNAFFTETLADLKEQGYLQLAVPEEFGGRGLSLVQLTRLQRRLAGADPAAALGINMHLIVTAAAAFALSQGLEEAADVLREAAAGELFAFGISEGGNDLMLFDSFTQAEPAGDGGYRVSGRKIFTSLSPAWTRLVVHAKERANAGVAEDRLVFGVLERGAGVESLGDWNTHGMRATQSHTTVLRDAELKADRVLATTIVGPDHDPLRFGIFGTFELLIAAVYCGLAERAITVAQDIAVGRRSATTGIAGADNPHIRWRVAEAVNQVDGAVLQIEKLAADFDALQRSRPEPSTVNHGARWYLQFSGVKARVTEAVIRAVDECVRASGGRHFSRDSELERLSRDARAAIYQPSNEESMHASYALSLFGEIGSER